MQGEGVGGEDGLRAGRDNDDGSETGFGARRLMSKNEYYEQVAALDLNFALDNPLYADKEIHIVHAEDHWHWLKLARREGTKEEEEEDEKEAEEEEEENKEEKASKGQREREGGRKRWGRDDGFGREQGETHSRRYKRRRLGLPHRGDLRPPLRKVKVVSATLASRSRFFKSLFEQPFSENGGQVIYLTAHDKEDAAAAYACISGLHQRHFPVYSASTIMLANMLAKAQEYMADESVSILAREIALRAGQSAGVSRHTMQNDDSASAMTLEELMYIYEMLPVGIETNPQYESMTQKLDKLLVSFFPMPDLYWSISCPASPPLSMERMQVALAPPEARKGFDLMADREGVVSPFLSPHVPLRSLSTKTFKHLLASPNIRVRHENTLFLLFQIYFAQKEDWQGDTPEEREKSRRAAVEEVLPSLRFPRMSSDFLSDVVAHSSLFADSPSATHLLVEALAYKSLSRLRQDRWIRLVRNELRIEHKAAQFKINQKAGIKPCPSEVQAAVREAESATSFNPVKSEPFRGTDVESCFSRLQDRTAVLQSQFITFAVDFSLQACLQLQPNQGLFSAVHECCGYLWTVQLVRLPIASIAPPSNPQAIRPSPSTCFNPSSSDRMGLWLHLLPMKPCPTSPFPHSKPRGLAAMVQLRINCAFDVLPGANHAWILFGGKEGKDNIKLPYLSSPSQPLLTEVELFHRRREGVREWSQIVSTQSGYFRGQAGVAPGFRGVREDSFLMRVEVLMRIED